MGYSEEQKTPDVVHEVVSLISKLQGLKEL